MRRLVARVAEQEDEGAGPAAEAGRQSNEAFLLPVGFGATHGIRF